MAPSRVSVGWVAGLCWTLAACSAGKSGVRGEREGASSGGSGGAGILLVDLDGGTSDAGPTIQDWPSDLPPPWQHQDGLGPAYRDPSAPEDVSTRFSGTVTSDGAPELVYPLAASMHPKNLLEIVFQWLSSGKTLFRIDAQAPDQTYRFYVACAEAQCMLQMPKSEWYDLGRRYAGQKLSFTINGTDGQGGPVAASAPIELSFSPEAVIGALYYWSSGTSELKRATFGSSHPVAFIQPNTNTSDFPCVSCHSVSRDGKVIAFAVSELEGHHGSAIRVAPTDDPSNPYVKPERGPSPWARLAAQYEGWAAPTDDQPPSYEGPTAHLGNMVSLNADGTLAAVNGFMEKPPNAEFRFFFEIRDARNGASIDRRDYRYLAASPPGDAVPIMPEWSPDGSAIAVTLADNAVAEGCIWAWNTCKGSIGIFQVQDGRLVGAPRVLVPFDDATGLGHFYPTWSPDGRFVAFASAEGESFDNSGTVLRLVRAEGGPHGCPGPNCWELTRATRYTPAEAKTVLGHSTWPKFTPFAQGPSKNLMFISFTTRLPYGFLSSENSQLWMFAVDTAALGAGADPSSSPIWLPYQELTDLSLTPYWAEILPCQSDAAGGCTGCVAGETCVTDSANHCQCVAQVVQ